MSGRPTLALHLVSISSASRCPGPRGAELSHLNILAAPWECLHDSARAPKWKVSLCQDSPRPRLPFVWRALLPPASRMAPQPREDNLPSPSCATSQPLCCHYHHPSGRPIPALACLLSELHTRPVLCSSTMPLSFHPHFPLLLSLLLFFFTHPSRHHILFTSNLRLL